MVREPAIAQPDFLFRLNLGRIANGLYPVGSSGRRIVKALSIRQPWAWLIVHGYKDIENRTWSSRFRGPVLVHAGKAIDPWDEDDDEFLLEEFGIRLPSPVKDLDRGGIVGLVEVVDCVSTSQSPWFNGSYGFVLRRPLLLPFQPCRGKLGFFDLDLEHAPALIGR